MTDFDWHPLAWEIARRAKIGSSPDSGGVWVGTTLSDGETLIGRGQTTDAACHDLARELTRWAGR